MLYINKVILQGRLVSDPELRQTKDGKSVCTIFVASQRKYKKDEESKVDIIKCEAWNGSAEYVTRNMEKGTMVNILGSTSCRKWQDENNKTRVDQFVHIDEIDFAPINNSRRNKNENNTTE